MLKRPLRRLNASHFIQTKQMSHRGGQNISVTATNHYPYFTHLPFATNHKTLSLPLNPCRKRKTNQHMEKPKAVDSPGLRFWTCFPWKVGEERKSKKCILKTMTARKKMLLLQREGLGQLPIHRVCAFAIARLNQYVSNSPWNTISPCLKKKTRNTQRED